MGLAQSEMKILIYKKLGVAGFEERPTEVPSKPCKYRFL